MEHPPRADDPDLDGVPVAGRPGVGRLAAHRADRAAGVADRDRVVELDLRAERRAHQREDVLAAQVGEPQGDAEQVGQLGLTVATAGRLRA